MVKIYLLLTLIAFAYAFDDCSIVYTRSSNAVTFTNNVGTVITVNAATPLPKVCSWVVGINCDVVAAGGRTITLFDTTASADVSGPLTKTCTTASGASYATNLIPVITPVDSLCVTVSGAGIAIQTLGGDPHFFGFLNQQFDFQGLPNKIFNIYSDPYLSINGLFTHYQHNTIVSVFSILFETHHATFFANQNTDAKLDLQLLYDDSIVSIPANSSVTLNNCVTASWLNSILTLKTPVGAVTILRKFSKLGEIYYLNLGLALYDIKDAEFVVGGILGATSLSDFDPKTLKNIEYIEPSLTSYISQSNEFRGKELCSYDGKETEAVRIAGAEHFIESLHFVAA